MDELFRKVFNDLALLKYIYEYVRIYKKNELVKFRNRKELLEYKEREYIETLVYEGKEALELGDIPSNYNDVLKEIRFKKWSPPPGKGKIIIPNGIKILEFSPTNFFDTPTFSELPKSINTLINVCTPFRISDDYIIPDNITSISFLRCLNISGNNDRRKGFVKIPNTIKRLKFDISWQNDDYQLNKGDFPDGLYYLSMGFRLNFNPNSIEGILPNSIKELYLTCNDIDENDGQLNKSLLKSVPLNIEVLSINYCFDLTPEHSNLLQFKSIKKLIIDFDNNCRIGIKPNSLPSLGNTLEILEIYDIPNIIELNTIPFGVKKLSLQFKGDKENMISKNSIPNSVTSLCTNKLITLPDVLPCTSLIELEFNTYSINLEVEHFIKMISILPASLKTIIIPKQFEEFNLKFPPTITKVLYD